LGLIPSWSRCSTSRTAPFPPRRLYRPIVSGLEHYCIRKFVRDGDGVEALSCLTSSRGRRPHLRCHGRRRGALRALRSRRFLEGVPPSGPGPALEAMKVVKEFREGAGRWGGQGPGAVARALIGEASGNRRIPRNEVQRAPRRPGHPRGGVFTGMGRRAAARLGTGVWPRSPRSCTSTTALAGWRGPRLCPWASSKGRPFLWSLHPGDSWRVGCARRPKRFRPADSVELHPGQGCPGIAPRGASTRACSARSANARPLKIVASAERWARQGTALVEDAVAAAAGTDIGTWRSSPTTSTRQEAPSSSIRRGALPGRPGGWAWRRAAGPHTPANSREDAFVNLEGGPRPDGRRFPGLRAAVSWRSGGGTILAATFSPERWTPRSTHRRPRGKKFPRQGREPGDHCAQIPHGIKRSTRAVYVAADLGVMERDAKGHARRTVPVCLHQSHGRAPGVGRRGLLDRREHTLRALRRPSAARRDGARQHLGVRRPRAGPHRVHLAARFTAAAPGARGRWILDGDRVSPTLLAAEFRGRPGFRWGRSPRSRHRASGTGAGSFACPRTSAPRGVLTEAEVQPRSGGVIIGRGAGAELEWLDPDSPDPVAGRPRLRQATENSAWAARPRCST